MTYAQNKTRAIYRDTTPTKTDQAGARESDINIIVGQQLITGYAPGAKKQPMYEDFSQLPTDLREMIERSRNMENMRNRLPPQLREMPLEQLLMLNKDELTRILTPEKPPAQAPPAPTT